MSPKIKIFLGVAVCVLPLDHATKLWVVNNVSQVQPLVVIEGFFHITHARNPGMALGLFQDVSVWVFVGLTLIALAMILSFLRRVPPADALSGAALGLITAGALGNLIDRVTRQEVVDFLQFDLGLFIFPDFNVADSAIVVGVVLLLLDVVASEAEAGGMSQSPET